MTITREQVAGLREGDIVEYHRHDWPDGTVLRGPLHRNGAGGWIAVGGFPVRYDNGGPNGFDHQEGTTLTVVSRVPRLYVNHDRGHPMPGDVVRDESSRLAHTWHYLGDHQRGRWWRFDDTHIPFDKDASLRLLVDGETGNVVPS